MSREHRGGRDECQLGEGFTEETAVRLVLGSHSGSVLLRRKAAKVRGTPRPSLGILSSPLLQESEITTGHPSVILQVLGSKMALRSTLLTWMEQ